jgi:hypothetical protein
VNREEMIAQLTRLREQRLREEVVGLQNTSRSRRLVEDALANATVSAQTTTESNIRDLGLFGEIRLGCIRMRKELTRQLLHRSERVMQARKKTESARTAHGKMVGQRLATEETLRERDAEHFLTWKRKP